MSDTKDSASTGAVFATIAVMLIWYWLSTYGCEMHDDLKKIREQLAPAKSSSVPSSTTRRDP